MPARDEILVIWFKLLALAGKTNQSGMLFMSNRIAYTSEMLSAVFNRELNVVKLALSTFQNFGMIEVEDNEIICISNWEKHQNIDGLEKIRLQTNERVKRVREKKKQLLLNDCNATCNATVTQSNATELELRVESKSLEGEGESRTKSVTDSLTFIPRFYEKTVGHPIPTDFYEICESYEKDGMEEPVIMQAIIKGKGKDVPHTFIKKVLKNWYQEGKLKIEDLKESPKQQESGNPFTQIRKEMGLL
jgi:predicted phage replisome organizer